MRTKQPKLGKKLLSLTIMLTILLTMSVPNTAYAYAVGNNVIPLSQITSIAKTNGWVSTHISDRNHTEVTPFNQYGNMVQSSNISVIGVNYLELSIIKNDLLRIDPSRPTFSDAYLQEMHSKGLLTITKLNLVLRTDRFYNGTSSYGGSRLLIGCMGTSGMQISPVTYATNNAQYPLQNQIIFRNLLSDTGFIYNPNDNKCNDSTSVTISTPLNLVQSNSRYYAFSFGRVSGSDTTSYSIREVPIYVDLNASTIECVLSPDTSQVGKIYDTVQSIPTTLNNTVNQINTSLANQPLALVYIPNNAQRTAQLAKLGLATNITTDGIYKSSDGFKYKVVFYTPPSSVDQLNLT